MKYTIYETKEIELNDPAYFRRSKFTENNTNWFIKVSNGIIMTTSNKSLYEFKFDEKDLIDFEPCTPDEFYQALTDNLNKINNDNHELAIKWQRTELQGGAYAD